MKPSKAQARELARIWASDRRVANVCIATPTGKPPYNDPTTLALVKRGWIVPATSDAPTVTGTGYTFQGHCLSWDGMRALADFIATEVRLSDNSAQAAE